MSASGSSTVSQLQNLTCPFCATELQDGGTKEHLIGRRFVPKGKLDRSWNLIVRACEACNRRKGDLEDDLSAITMHPDAFGKFAADDVTLREEAARKASGSFSRRTGRPVAKSLTEMEVTGKLGWADLTFNLVGPPQPDADRLAELANLHVNGLAYHLTYDSQTRRGYWFAGKGVLVNDAPRRDWGNSLQRSYVRLVGPWEPVLLRVAAEGYFKAVFRQDRETRVIAWALEWNRARRIIGFRGPADAVDGFVDELEPPTLTELPRTEPGVVTRVREEVPLRPEEDRLFELGADGEAKPSASG